MGNKREVFPKNYLERVPVCKVGMDWSVDENERVVLHIENKGAFNRIAQKLFKKPKVTYIHLDETGSFIWPVIDGERDLIAIGKLVEERFGEAANPLYERVAKFFQILHSYGFIEWQETNTE